LLTNLSRLADAFYDIWHDLIAFYRFKYSAVWL
jgi:hypothetical protein